MLYFGIYLLIVNLIAFIVWCMDKYFAKAGKRRISEKMLFVWALIGGSIGSLTAMHTVRHKTREQVWSLPAKQGYFPLSLGIR